MTYYDSIARGYEELHGEEQRKKIKIIQEHINPGPQEKLLDVGCGTGLTTVPWKCKRYGIDPAAKVIERARDKENVTYRIASAEEIPYPDNTFDYVISVTAIQNFKEVEKGLREIARVGRYRFVLTYLKRSIKAALIENRIRHLFNVDKVVEETKDMIFFCTKKQA